MPHPSIVDGLFVDQVAEIIEEIRGIHPEVMKKVPETQYTSHQKDSMAIKDMISKAQVWMSDENKNKDLLAHEGHLNGFEWPSIIWIVDIDDWKMDPKKLQPSKDLLMRTVSTFVKVVYFRESGSPTPPFLTFMN